VQTLWETDGRQAAQSLHQQLTTNQQQWNCQQQLPQCCNLLLGLSSSSNLPAQCRQSYSKQSSKFSSLLRQHSLLRRLLLQMRLPPMCNSNSRKS
jgi:hypothetical protein